MQNQFLKTFTEFHVSIRYEIDMQSNKEMKEGYWQWLSLRYSQLGSLFTASRKFQNSPAEMKLDNRLSFAYRCLRRDGLFWVFLPMK